MLIFHIFIQVPSIPTVQAQSLEDPLVNSFLKLGSILEAINTQLPQFQQLIEASVAIFSFGVDLANMISLSTGDFIHFSIYNYSMPINQANSYDLTILHLKVHSDQGSLDHGKF